MLVLSLLPESAVAGGLGESSAGSASSGFVAGGSAETAAASLDLCSVWRLSESAYAAAADEERVSFSSALSGALGGAWASSRAGSDEARSSAVASSAPPSPRSAHDGARSVVSSALGGFVPSNGHALATRGVSAESRSRCGESTDAESRSRCGESTVAARAPVDERAIGTAAANSLAAVATADNSVLDISRLMSSSHDRDSSRHEGRHEGCPTSLLIAC